MRQTPAPTPTPSQSPQRTYQQQSYQPLTRQLYTGSDHRDAGKAMEIDEAKKKGLCFGCGPAASLQLL